MGSRAEIGTVGRWPPASKSSLPLPLPCRPLRPFGCRKLIRPRGGGVCTLQVRTFVPVRTYIWPGIDLAQFPAFLPPPYFRNSGNVQRVEDGEDGEKGKCYPVRNKSTFILPGNKPGNAATCPAVQFSMRAKRGEHFSFLFLFLFLRILINSIESNCVRI